MIFLSAGHHLKDPGAVANGTTEAALTMELRDLIIVALKAKAAKFITDDDRETLTQYLNRIKPGDGSVLCELHFNASTNPKATGVEVLIPSRGGSTAEQAMERKLAESIANMISKHAGLIRRGKLGVITEAESHRGSLAFMREPGINVLVEVGFITNVNDLAAYRRNKEKIAVGLAQLLIEADGWVK